MLLTLAVVALAATSATVASEAACKGLVDGPKLEFADPIGPEHSVVAGGRMELVCSVMAAPTASIVWLHNGKEVDMHEGPKEHLIHAGKRLGISMLESRLVRECASAEDAGQYSCLALSPCAKAIKQSTVVKIAGKGSSHCSSSSPPFISLHTYSRMELPSVPVQLVCRSSNPLVNPRWERVADDDSTSAVGFAATGFLQLPSGDLIVDPTALTAQDGEEVVAVTMRCYVGAAHVDSSVIFMDEE